MGGSGEVAAVVGGEHGRGVGVAAGADVVDGGAEVHQLQRHSQGGVGDEAGEVLQLGLAAAGGDGPVVERRLGDAEAQVAALGEQPVFAVEVVERVAGEHDAQDADGEGGQHDSRSEAFAAMPEDVERADCETRA